MLFRSQKHKDVSAKYLEALDVLMNLGDAYHSEVVKFCADSGQTPCGWEGMIRLRKGLEALALLWNIKVK